MKKNIIVFSLLLFFVFIVGAHEARSQNTPSHLVVLWTSGDREVAEKVCMMYAHAAKTNNWFKEVTFIVWGPSSKLLTEDVALQQKVKAMMDDGVDVKACIACAGMYGVVNQLRALGLEVKPMGEPLSDFLKDENIRVLTF